MSNPIKQGDVVTLEWDLDPAPAAGSQARLIITRRDETPIVDRIVSLAGARVTATLTADETAVGNTYLVGVVTTPGPVTYPSSGWDSLTIEPDLDPTTP